MTEHHYHNSAEQLGRRFGRAWRGLLGLQMRCRRALLQAGLPAAVANVLIATVWLVVVAGILRYGLWIAMVALVLVVLLSLGVSDVPNSVDREYQWRRGFLGFGLYDENGFRVDPHDPEKKN